VNVACANEDDGDRVIDAAALFDVFEGDLELIREIAGLFREDGPKRLAAARLALAQEDAAALVRAAHSLKGSATNFGAGQAVAAALELETLARVGDLATAKAVCERLEREIGKLMDALASLEQPPRA
jgi:HPt (histidine-containing phosphotransfer) domain-containing protein